MKKEKRTLAKKKHSTINFHNCNNIYEIARHFNECEDNGMLADENNIVEIDERIANITLHEYQDALQTIRIGLKQLGDLDLITAEEFEYANRHFDNMLVNANEGVRRANAYISDVAYILGFVSSAIKLLETFGVIVVKSMTLCRFYEENWL